MPEGTGTIYGLTDPRTGQVRYVGQTKRALQVRLRGHLTGGKNQPRVRAWITDLWAENLRPGIAAIREEVPADGLREAETEEITRVLAAGGALLNEVQTGLGHEQNRKRVKAARDEAERAGWAALATIALDTLGGPMAPGGLSEIEMPDARHEALTTWFAAAVSPWQHLAEISGLPRDDASFIAWAGRDAGTREALEFLSPRSTLRMMSEDWERERWHGPGPGRMLATIAAAYADADPSDAIRSDVVEVLRRAADDHQLSAPMAALMMRLDPQCLDTAFGPDIAAAVDDDLQLPPGTAGFVARALAGHLGHAGGEALRRLADRAAQELPVVSLPSYDGWHGPGVLAARAVSALLVQAGLAEPDWMTADEYLAKVRGLWVPRVAPESEPLDPSMAKAISVLQSVSLSPIERGERAAS